MSSIGKMVGALVSGTQETSFALANLNFDFSLIKVESPLEYRGLGAALSSQRRESAEDGEPHITARKLGAIFEQLVPSIPTLTKAYGCRASEIAANPKANPQGIREDGFLADHIGLDGTTIWAAATAGKGAISMHLLACMLARLWTSQQATSIWVELVAGRKKELNAILDMEGLNWPAAAAAQVSISREQLRLWDAGARAWLQSADKAMSLQQLQMMLIVDNVNIPVNTDMDVYKGVLKAWKVSLIAVEALLCGMPQRVQDGAVLLGLSAWHLYPDMLVLGTKNTEVEQKDPLVPTGGVLTVGFKSMSPDAGKGVFWSLPLAHLRFYGDPVKTSGSIGVDASRIPFDELLQVVFGSVCSTWDTGRLDIFEAAKLIKSLHQYEHDGASGTDIVTPIWLDLLAGAAVDLLKSTGLTRKSYRRLISLGQRRGSFLTPLNHHPAPVFNLMKYHEAFSVFKGEENRIAALRAIAAALNIGDDGCVIRYLVPFEARRNGLQPRFEYATAIPYLRKSTKRSSEGTEQHVGTHLRWLPRFDTIAENTEVYDNEQWSRFTTCFEKCGNNCDDRCVCRRARRTCTSYCHCSGFRKFGEEFTCSYLTHVFSSGDREYKVTEGGENWCIIDPNDVEDTKDPIFWWDMTTGFDGQPRGPNDTGRISFKIVVGDPESAAIFRRQDKSTHQAPYFDRIDKLSTLQTFLDKNYIDKKLLSDHLNRLAPVKEMEGRNHGHRVPKHVHEGNQDEVLPDNRSNLQERYFESLTALVAAKYVYDQMDGATLDLGITSKPICMTNWFPGRHKFANQGFLTRSQVFSCISHFETGSLNLLPSSLDKVMAISSGNSIFVAASLCKDPWLNSYSSAGIVYRYVGNVGKAGVILLVPPAAPRIRQLDPASWKLINHDAFDGKMTDSFQSTSLHLSFTEYELPVDTGSYGSRDGQAFFLESLVSVCDHGDWIADLNVLGIINDPKCHRLPLCNNKSHDCKAVYNPEKTQNTLTSIDSWLELLDLPNNGCIVRSEGNWCGRLATAAVSIQRGYTTLLLPNATSNCWVCLYEWLEWYKMRQEFGESDGDDDAEEAEEGEPCDEEENSYNGSDNERRMTEGVSTIHRVIMIIT
jgi:hypothetical protein